jgi:hypothetical protein
LIKKEFHGLSNMRATDEEKASLWDISDYDFLTKVIKGIQLANHAGRITILRDIEYNLTRRWNDQKSGTNWKNGKRFEPHQVEFAGNLVVNSGLILLSELLSGEAFEVPLWLASGTGTSEVSQDQETLDAEIARNSVMAEGWRTSDGNSVKMGSRFDPNTASADITEFGSFDEVVAGDMEWRVLLPGQALSHTQGSTFYMSFHTLYLNPK